MTQEIHDLARNQGFLRLHRELNKFNIFHATGMSNQEIKHTQFLGYLLDPNESHGFKDEFLIRFLQSLPKSEGAEEYRINILDFNLSYTRVIKEKSFAKIRNRLDLLIEIPSLANPEKLYTIAIENKIRAKAGRDQLKTYKKAIQEEYLQNSKQNSILLYLTVNNEEPNDENWVPILYSDTVIKAIKSLIEDLEETISDYMIFILKDYIEFINKEGGYESDGPLEKIILEIDSETINQSRQLINKIPKSIEQERLETRYQKALKYIVKYDADPRKTLLEFFKSKFNKNEGEEKLEYENHTFTLESSNKNWMRFSFLSDENGQKLSKLCENPTRNWLASRRNLAFEFIFSKPNDKNEVDCRVSLILGPTGSEYKKRNELLNAIKGAYNKTYNGNGNGNGNGSANTDSEDQSHFDAIKRGAFRKYNKNNLNPNQAKNWIEDTLKKISEEEMGFIKEVNKSLKEFFNTEGSTPSNT